MKSDSTVIDIEQEILLGNTAIARGLVEAGCHIVTSYPGTPSSEILPGVVMYKKRHNLDTYIEWSVNEKVAFEVALAASYTGKRAAVMMKQVGLNVAADPLMSSAYTGVKGGFVVISADDPGPHSSQTEQDTRFWGLFAKVPVFDPSSPREAAAMVKRAFELSEEFEIPVILRPVLRVCHAKQNIRYNPISDLERKAFFRKKPNRWAAIPRFRLQLHTELNRKLAEIQARFETSDLNYVVDEDAESSLGIISGNVAFATAQDLLRERGLKVPILKIGTPHPLPQGKAADFVKRFDRVLILEETDAVIELQIRDKSRILGRLTGDVPNQGELTPEVMDGALSKFLGIAPLANKDSQDAIGNIITGADLPVRKPTLCPGCPERAAFYAIRKAFPRAIFPSDIGCYTLGLNLKAVDTCLDMGGAVTIACGLYQAYKHSGEFRPIIATIGDSTFFHSGTAPLMNAVYNDARFTLIILDNEITAMTGMQPTPGTGGLPDGSQGVKIPLEQIVEGCGVRFMCLADPYDIPGMIAHVKDAVAFNQSPEGGVAVIIARFPCVLHQPQVLRERQVVLDITEECNGCMVCVGQFECPALVPIKSEKRVEIDRKICVNCGLCVITCPFDAIVPRNGK